MVSSTDRMRQAASEAAVRALVRTMDGSQTHAAKLSAMSSLLMSTPYHIPPCSEMQSYRFDLICLSVPLIKLKALSACVFVSYLCVFGAQFVQDVCCVKAGVVTQLSGDDLQGLGVRSNQQLLFSRDGPGIIPQVLGQLHLHSSSTRYNGVVLEMGSIQSVCTE